MTAPAPKPTKTPIWQAIATALRAELAEAHYAPGDKLPTEAQLSERFGVNRHTVRRALSQLIDEGLLRSRRGAGVFVAARPADYPIGRRVRFHENLLAAGRLPSKQVLSLQTRAADAGEAAALTLNPGDPVLVYYGLSLADGVPLAVAQSLFPSTRLPGLEQAIRDESGISAALARVGVADFTRASTRLTAVAADATQALHLQVAEGAPLLRSTGINLDPDGKPLEFGRTWFAGDRITLTLEG